MLCGNASGSTAGIGRGFWNCPDTREKKKKKKERLQFSHQLPLLKVRTEICKDGLAVS